MSKLAGMSRAHRENKCKQGGYQEHAVDWVIGAAALIALVIAIGANRRISNMRDEGSRRIEVSLKSAIGILKADADENAQLLKRMSDQIL